MTLRDARDAIVKHTNPVGVLMYADKLMRSSREMGDAFKLNHEDAWLLPLLENYRDNLDLWQAFVKNVRDRLEPYSATYFDVQAFFKTLGTRQAQQKIRTILAVAIPFAVKKRLIPDSFPEKQRYERRCRAYWKERRMNLLKSARAASPTGRVSLDHQEELLKQLWDQIAEEVDRGELPKP